MLGSLLLIAALFGGDDAPHSLAAITGEELRGRLRPAPDGRIGWESRDFEEPLVILPETLHWIRLDPDEDVEREDRETLMRFELTGGDVLIGAPLAVDEAGWEIDALELGIVRIAPTALRSAERLGGSRVLFNGPNGIAGWRNRKKSAPWRAEGDLLVADGEGALVDRDLGLTDDCSIVLELGWADAPGFRLGLGGRRHRKIGADVTVENWGRALVAWRELASRLEWVELAAELPDDGTHVLRARFTEERITFLDADGGEIGGLGRGKQTGPFLQMENEGARTELRSVLVISGEDGPTPTRLDGNAIVSFAPEAMAFATEQESTTFDAVLGIDFPGNLEPPPLEPGAVWLAYTDGRRLGGEFVRVTEDSIAIRPAWADAEVACPLEGLESIDVVREHQGTRRRRKTAAHVESTHGAVAGELRAIEADGGIVWKPTIAEGTVTLDAEAVERIVLNKTSAYFVSSRKFPHRLWLRTGDTFRCKAILLTEDELRFESPFGGERTVSPDIVKALELHPRSMERLLKDLEKDREERKASNNHGWGWGQPTPKERKLDVRSLDRALALPRKYKQLPMTHLVMARNGDFLRTDLLSWNEKGALYEGNRSDTRLIPDDRLAAIVWLDHPSEGPGVTAAASEEGDRGVRVVLDDETRFDLRLSATGEDALEGRSPELGDLTLAFSRILAIELVLDEERNGTPFDDWTLRPMKEPFPGSDDGPAEEAAAGAKPVVGAKAPPTSGTDLDGNALALSDYEGKVVLLNFWGHW